MPWDNPSRSERAKARARRVHPGIRDGKSRDDNRRRQADPRQALAMKLRSTARWQRLRSLFLDAHPFCAHCEQRGVVRSSAQVDHVTALRRFHVELMEEACFDEANLQALCTECHAAKSARENAMDRGGRHG